MGDIGFAAQAPLAVVGLGRQQVGLVNLGNLFRG
jgi:hypothetical protein